jgi:hypothetical protein
MPVDILITESRLPQIGGLELLKHARESFPQTKVLVSSNTAPAKAPWKPPLESATGKLSARIIVAANRDLDALVRQVVSRRRESVTTRTTSEPELPARAGSRAMSGVQGA